MTREIEEYRELIFRSWGAFYKKEEEVIGELSKKYSKGSIKYGKGKRLLEENKDLVLMREDVEKLEKEERYLIENEIQKQIREDQKGYDNLNIFLKMFIEENDGYTIEKSKRSSSTYLKKDKQTIIRFSDHSCTYVFPYYQIPFDSLSNVSYKEFAEKVKKAEEEQ